MSDAFDDLYARVIVERGLEVAPGHTVMIESTMAGAPLCDAVHRRALLAGAHPVVRLWPSGWVEGRVECAHDDVLAGPDRLRAIAYPRIDRRVIVMADTNTRATAGAPPERLATQARSHGSAVRVLIRRDDAGEARWCVAQYATAAFAAAGGMTLEDYRAFLGRALLLDHVDPVAAWREVETYQSRVVDALMPMQEFHVRGPGTDIHLRTTGRTWISAHGTHNLPDGEVFTAPHEDATEGVVTFDPPATWQGRRVVGARLRFSGGRCVDAGAREGEDVLIAALDSDEGARVIGEFAFGLNPGVDRVTANTLLDEKIGGTMHLAMGASYSVCGGLNRSGLHWDLVCDLRRESEVTADGRAIYRDGAFLPELTAR